MASTWLRFPPVFGATTTAGSLVPYVASWVRFTVVSSASRPSVVREKRWPTVSVTSAGES